MAHAKALVALLLLRLPLQLPYPFISPLHYVLSNNLRHLHRPRRLSHILGASLSI